MKFDRFNTVVVTIGVVLVICACLLAGVVANKNADHLRWRKAQACSHAAADSVALCVRAIP